MLLTDSLGIELEADRLAKERNGEVGRFALQILTKCHAGEGERQCRYLIQRTLAIGGSPVYCCGKHDERIKSLIDEDVELYLGSQQYIVFGGDEPIGEACEGEGLKLGGN